MMVNKPNTVNNSNHFKTDGFVCAKYIIISPKNELAHANHSRVIFVGSSTEKD